MLTYDRSYASPGGNDRKLVEVRMPRQHEGIHRALKSSFEDIPAMPNELDRLLARLR